ncbi:MAG: hypothetical protein KAR44_10400 [Candidatus Aegiribacteria sp.]|nr:hypothetical protein [Candidatus Aegiribacteria sp.]
MPDHISMCTNFLGLVDTFENTIMNPNNTIMLELDRYKITIKQDKNVVRNQPRYFQDRTAITSKVIVQGVTASAVQNANRIRDRILELLSFISMSYVIPSIVQFPPGTNIDSNVPRGYACYYKPVIEIRDAKIVKDFIEQVWTKYNKIYRRRKLHEVMEYLAISDFPHQPIESKLVLVIVALEFLKTTYAHSSGIPFISGSFRKVSTPPKANIKREPKYSFEDLLTKMLMDAGMPKGIKRIIRLRNELFHAGLTNICRESKMKRYNRIHDIIREYLLRIMEYKGNYISYSDPDSFKHI